MSAVFICFESSDESKPCGAMTLFSLSNRKKFFGTIGGRARVRVERVSHLPVRLLYACLAEGRE